MTGETGAKPELSVTELTQKVEEAHTALLEHAAWILGMPFETPIRVQDLMYAGEEHPRSLDLLVRLDEQRVLTVCKDLTGSETPWRVYATNEPTYKVGVDFVNTNLSLYADGTAQSNQYDMVEGGSTGICIGDERDEVDEVEGKIGVDNPMFGSHIVELLDEAVRDVPERQRDFLEAMGGTPEFRLANLMQKLREPGFLPPGKTLDGASLKEELSAPDFPDWIHPDTFGSNTAR